MTGIKFCDIRAKASFEIFNLYSPFSAQKTAALRAGKGQ
jgi:hypothetical protein